VTPAREIDAATRALAVVNLTGPDTSRLVQRWTVFFFLFFCLTFVQTTSCIFPAGPLAPVFPAGLPAAVEEIWPRADRQHCAVHRRAAAPPNG
jgi:hypothetical protein